MDAFFHKHCQLTTTTGASYAGCCRQLKLCERNGLRHSVHEKRVSN